MGKDIIELAIDGENRLRFSIDILRHMYYELCMIKSFANSASKRFYDEGKASKFGGMDCDAADELLASLDAAVSLKDLSPLKSVGLHKLKGNRKGQWAMTVNGPCGFTPI